ncbi:MAG: CaiB/BaiF CoA transferase family protein [Candidatus Limnocylindria bacterium]
MENQSTAAGPARTAGPLAGIRVVELGTMIAGPFAGRLLADLGADVIKVEPPGKGDPLRDWKHLHGGTSLWWRVQSRNKRCVTADLRRPEGQALVRQLIARSDVLIENFRPGTLERWGLAPDDLRRERPELVAVRVSGFGQTGPYRGRTGLGAVAEAMGGIRYITGDPDTPPSRTGISLADELAALFAVIGAIAGLLRRERTGRGDTVDVALYEAVFALMEAAVTEYAYSGDIRERSGGSYPGVAPSNTYPTADGAFVVIGGNTDELFKRLMACVGRPDLAQVDRYRTNPGRAADATLLDAAIAAWTGGLTLGECLAALEAAGVPAGPIYTIADIAEDPQYRARGMLLERSLPDGTRLTIPGLVPKFTEAPGSVDWLGPERLGADNATVYGDLLGLGSDQLEDLAREGVI